MKRNLISLKDLCKINVSRCLYQRHNTKTPEGMEVLVHTFLTSILYRDERKQLHATTDLLPGENRRYPLDREQRATQDRSRHFGEKANFCLLQETNPDILGLPARSPATTSTTLARILNCQHICL